MSGRERDRAARAEHSPVAPGQAVVALGQQVQLLLAEPVEAAIGVVGGDDDRTSKKWYGVSSESRCRQKHFGGAAVDGAMTRPR